MDDLAGKLNEILNNPTEMAKFQQMANNLLGQMNTEQQNNGCYPFIRSHNDLI